MVGVRRIEIARARGEEEMITTGTSPQSRLRFRARVKAPAHRRWRANAKPQAAILAILVVLGSTALAGAQAPKKDRLEDSIDRALGFLQTMQEPDGAWLYFGQKSPAITSLAVLAYLSAGHVPGEGPYAPLLDKGIRWVLSQQDGRGLIGAGQGLEMYHHGISTIMLTQVCGMTDAKLGKEVRAKVERAVKIILQAQLSQQGPYQGGWRYNVVSLDADISVSGWQILALRGAKNIGCDVPSERIDRAIEFVLRCRDLSSGGFCYTPGGRVTLSCTGTCVLALELCGKERHRGREALQAGSYLLKHPLRWGDEHFPYAAYYGAQATFQLGNNYWNFYRPQLHKALLGNQQANGSWLDQMGPVYATSLSVLALTVEYRYLPIYQRHEEAETPKK
jgi:hypothetical protein